MLLVHKLESSRTVYDSRSLKRRRSTGSQVSQRKRRNDESIEQRMTKIGLTELSEEPIHKTLTARVVARRFETAWRNNRQYPFSLNECGQLQKPFVLMPTEYRLNK